MYIAKSVALILAVIGGINWGLVGLFQFDLVAAIFGGQDATLARIVYVLVAISAMWSLSLLGNLKRDTAIVAGHPQRT